VHVIVVLADNQHQGIVPVPAELGNGRQPRTNLYWGAMYGVKTFLERSAHWRRIDSSDPPRRDILETCVFAHATADPPVYLVAMAYDGRAMRAGLDDFFAIAAGRKPVRIDVRGLDEPLACGSDADLLAFVGHNGLMDTRLDDPPDESAPPHPAEAVVLACRSKPHFAPRLETLGCRPLVMTTGLMAPEAYTLEALLESWRRGEPANDTRRAAAAAYARYQRCRIAAARRLFDAPAE
jgi:hypothetical protein